MPEFRIIETTLNRIMTSPSLCNVPTIHVIRFYENYLPRFMRLNFFGRLFRFSFTPLFMLMLIMLFNADFSLTDLKLCNNRKLCLNNCETDNFPSVQCVSSYSLNYKGNLYQDVYKYQKPSQGNTDFFN